MYFSRKGKDYPGKSRRMAFLAIFLVLLLNYTGLLWGQRSGSNEEALSPFVEELLNKLEDSALSDEEMQLFVESASKLEWGEVEGVDPEMVALALEWLMGGKEELNSEELALAAWELGVMAGEMGRLGFEERTVLRATINVARDIASSAVRLRNQDDREKLGRIMREIARNQIKAAVKKKAIQRIEEKLRGKPGETPGVTALHGPPDSNGPPHVPENEEGYGQYQENVPGGEQRTSGE